MLLLHRAAQSFHDLRTINGIEFPTFHEAACQLGLFDDQHEGQQALQEAVECLRTPSQLRFLFAQIILEGYPAMPLWMEFRPHLIFDNLIDYHDDDEMASNATLNEVARYLSHVGRRLADFGLPDTPPHSAELQQEFAYLRENRAFFEEKSAHMQENLNDEQQRIFNFIKATLECRHAGTFFVEGRPGRGKSFLINALSSMWRANNHIVLIVASSALSAICYPRGRTAHYLFGIPVTDDNINLKSTISPFSCRAHLIRAAHVIIWDELPMANKAAWECVHNLCCSITGKQQPFGGIPFIGAGDFRQVAPVIRGGDESATLMASVKSSFLWRSIELLSLSIPVRSIDDIHYTHFVDEIGEDVSGNRRTLPLLHSTFNVNDAVNFLFPPDVLRQPHLCLQRAFLSPRNIFVDKFNEAIMRSMPDDYRSYSRMLNILHILIFNQTLTLARILS